MKAFITNLVQSIIFPFIFGCLAFTMFLKMIFRLGIRQTFRRNKHERPPALDDPKFGTHSFVKVEDVKIHYVASGPEDKPLMLFLHGFPEFWYSWRYQLLEFQKDYRVVAIDMRGYGESDKPSGIESYMVDLLMNDVKCVIQGLGYQKCILVAHDWGGAVAWAFARAYSEFVDKLIVMNCPPSPAFKVIMETRKEQLSMSWYVFFFQIPVLPEWFITLSDYGILDQLFGRKVEEGGVGEEPHHYMKNPFSDEDYEAYKYTFSQPGAITPPVNYYRAALSGKRKMYDMKYDMPVLLIWGVHDLALHRDIPEVTQSLCPTVQVHKIGEAGHFVQMDTPEETNKAMREWLVKVKAV